MRELSGRSLSNRQRAFLEVAGKIALTSECRQIHGAVIVRGGSILGAACNKFRNHPRYIKNYNGKVENCSEHAEIAAIRKAGNCKNATIYVARVRTNGKYGLSRPCMSCYKAIVDAGITTIVYTDDQ